MEGPDGCIDTWDNGLFEFFLVQRILEKAHGGGELLWCEEFDKFGDACTFYKTLAERRRKWERGDRT